MISYAARLGDSYGKHVLGLVRYLVCTPRNHGRLSPDGIDGLNRPVYGCSGAAWGVT
ncbi:hypothetical protein Pth03_82930 [Planotetraspora thailandica]|uniref:Uncharacterized protein n=1 Tax=Planotetraspora thailandica TaxID=487172 RepID=A0A8J3Y333_9ACTN|nr:hypothetical protein Pth03_82930 [Planotetraspora thailandica]